MKRLLVFLFFAVLPPAFADQNTAFLETDKKNRAGSDESLKHSTVFAMSALMDLGNLNIPAAVNNGITAYGKYRNSGTLDRLSNENMLNSASMSSAGTEAPTINFIKTTFRRLDPSFLRSGKYSQVAEQFEKKTGMKREQFLTKLSDVSEKKLKKDDPQLAQKALQEFEGFISAIPNQSFRANLQKGVNLVPKTIRTELIAKAVTKFSSVSPPSGNSQGAQRETASAPAAAAISVPAASSSGPLASAPPETPQEPGAAPDPALASPIAEAQPSEQKNALQNVIVAALDTQGEEPSIFQQVSRKYRSLTPQLQP